jgi:hypothetical protein
VDDGEEPGCRKWPRIAWEWTNRTWSANASWFALAFLGIAAALGVVATIQAIELDDRHFHFQWGTAPEGFAAVAGGLAAVGTVGALYIAIREYARDNELRRQREHREQAEHFTVWVAEVGTRVAEVVGTSPGTPFITVGLINASSGVLSDLRFQITCVPDINVREDLRPYVRMENEAHAYLPVLPPGPARTVDIELPGESTGMVDSADVYFYDQRNVKWRRDLVTGHLSESSARPFIVELSEDGPGDPLEEDGFITVQWLGPAVGLVTS